MKSVETASSPAHEAGTARSAPKPEASPTPEHARLQAALGNRAVRGLLQGDQQVPYLQDLRASFGRFGSILERTRAGIGGAAVTTAAAFDAHAVTVGDRIFFGAAPSRALVAHEAAHVVHQRHGVTAADEAQCERNADEVGEAFAAGRQAEPVLAQFVRGRARADVALVQRKALTPSSPPQGGAVPGEGDGIDLIFIVKDRSGYTAQVRDYVKHTLVGQDFKEVVDLDGIFHQLANLREAKKHVRRIRIVTHGWDTGAVSVATPRPRAGQVDKRLMTPGEVADYARRPEKRAVVNAVMSPGAVVEFWGCSIGNSKEANQAWADLFRSKFTSTTGYFYTNSLPYYRLLRPGEHQRGMPIGTSLFLVTNSRQVDTWPAVGDTALYEYEKKDFESFLLRTYMGLVADREIAPLPSSDAGAMLAFMRDLFNRSHGVIREIGVKRKDADTYVVTPADGAAWSGLWVTYSPVGRDALLDGPPPSEAPRPPPVAPPPSPAGAAVSSPASRASAPPPATRAPVSPPRVAPPPSRAPVSPGGVAPRRAPPEESPERVAQPRHAPPHRYHRERNAPAGSGEALTRDWYRVWGFDIASADIGKRGIREALDRVARSLRQEETHPARVTVYGEESVSRRVGPRDAYANERAEAAAAYLRGQHIANLQISSLGHAPPPLPAPIELGVGDAMSSPEEKSQLRAVVIHVERARTASKEKTEPEGPQGAAEHGSKPSYAARIRFSHVFHLPPKEGPPAPLGPYLYGRAEFEVRGEILVSAHDAHVAGTYTADMLKKKAEAEYKRKLSNHGTLKLKGSISEKLIAELRGRNWKSLAEIVKGEIELGGFDTDSVTVGLELSKTFFYVMFKTKRENTILDVVGADVLLSVEVRATGKVGPNFRALAASASGLLTTELGTPTALGVALPVGGFLVGATAWTAAGLLSIGAASRKGRIEAAGHLFSEGYADMIATLATGGVQDRWTVPGENRERRVAAAAKAYADHGDVWAIDELRHGGGAAALQHVVHLGAAGWLALQARLRAIGGFDAIRRAYRERVFKAVCDYLGPVDFGDLATAAKGGLEPKDMWHLAESTLSPR